MKVETVMCQRSTSSDASLKMTLQGRNMYLLLRIYRFGYVGGVISHLICTASHKGMYINKMEINSFAISDRHAPRH
jgi:hypothetical protein